MKLRFAAQLSLIVVLMLTTIGASWESSGSDTSSKVQKKMTTTTTVPTTTTTTETPTTTSTTLPPPPPTTTTTQPYTAPMPAPQPAAQVSTSSASNSSIWDCIIAHESGGNPSAVNSSSGAGGLFQFLPSSWAAYGGTVYASLPEYASVSAQWDIAVKAQAQSGWWPWKGDGCTPVG